jgi:DNA polymerase-3 subunit delta
MKLYPDKLAAQTKQNLLPLYIISGEETLLINESADLVRQAARQQDFQEREVFHADTSHFQWEEVLQSLNSLSLFSEKKLVEIRCAKKHLNHKGFLEYWQQPNPDCVVLIITEKLDRSTLNTKWFTALDRAGALVQIWPLDADRFPRWLQQRAQQQGLVIEPDALRILQERTEGNLLAAAQELEKLFLLYGKQAITADSLHQTVADSARYNIFDLIDQCLQGNSIRSLNILQHLLEEGQNEFPIVRSLTREIRLLGILQEAAANGQKPAALFKRHNIWEKRQTLYQRALKRLSLEKIKQLAHQAQQLDLVIMGLARQNIDNSLQALCLGLCDVQTAAGTSHFSR